MARLLLLARAFAMTHPYSWSEWTKLGARQLARHVRSGEVTPTELAAQARDAARRIDPILEALVELLDAPVTAPDLELSKDNLSAGLLAGVPAFLKDMGSSVAGLRRELGSALHRDERVTRTDPLTATWLGQGLQILGRATTAELGMAYDTSTVYRGLQITRNPWDVRHTAGGSSGGSAALVSAGVVPIAHGTDGAGSIRQPAALTGVVGLKVSRGLLPLPWGVNELLNTSMVEGVFTRSLEDTALALDAATRDRAPLGKRYIGSPHQPLGALTALERDPERLRIGVTVHDFGRRTPCEPFRANKVREVAEALALAGHVVEEIHERELPDFAALWRSFEIFWAGIRTASWRLHHGALSEQALADLSPMVRAYWHASERYGKREVVRYLTDNVRHSLAFGRLFSRFDIVLLPVVPYATPLANGELSPAVEQDFDEFLQHFLDAGRYTIPANEAGFPALSLPVGLDPSGLPVAVQLYGRFREETALLQAGRAVQSALPSAARHIPSVHTSRWS